MNSWRQLAIATYTAPKDSRIYGTYEVDVTSVLQYIKEKREAGSRKKEFAEDEETSRF